MIVLALETVTRAGSVAIIDGDRCQATTGDASRTHGERLPQDLLDVAVAAGHTIQDVDLFAIVIGPGSFTGLRVGVAAVQGLALTSGKRVVAVPTLEAIATGWLDSADPAREVALVACLDGQRGQLFHAAWQGRGRQPIDRAMPLWAPAVSEPEDLLQALAALPADRPKVVVSDGTGRYAEAFSAAAEVSALTTPLAAVAARIAADHPERAVAPHGLRPIYLRQPDAVLARARARAVPHPVPAESEAAGAGVWSVSVDRATADDLPAVARLQQQTFTNPWAVEALRWELEHTDVARLYVARTDTQEIVGYCACWLVFDELHVNSLAVESSWRRRGIARQLWRRAMADGLAEGARSATLEVRRSNEAARALYEGLGFRVEGVRHNYYQNPREDALILWHRHLSARPPG
jgi:tRNA threonylcarbamoyl adenosine modification protein YeaZ/ribosomal-protein-alanine acetyltransferase